MLGTSVKTTLLGYAFALVTVIGQTISSGSVMPHTVEGWITYVAALIVAVMGRMAKDHDVSNAPSPADAAPIPPAVKP